MNHSDVVQLLRAGHFSVNVSFDKVSDKVSDKVDVRLTRHSVNYRQLLSAWVLPVFFSTCPVTAAESNCPIQLRDVTRQTGIAFVHTDGSSGRRYIVETVCSGLATFDFNGDGKIDILFLNGAPLPGSPTTTPPPRNALYRNDGGWKFTDVTQAAGLGDTDYHLGVCVGDYDNDGDADIYLNNFGPNILYRNNGDRTFTDVTREAGVAVGHRVGAGACFLDMDRDGD